TQYTDGKFWGDSRCFQKGDCMQLLFIGSTGFFLNFISWDGEREGGREGDGRAGRGKEGRVRLVNCFPGEKTRNRSLSRCLLHGSSLFGILCSPSSPLLLKIFFSFFSPLVYVGDLYFLFTLCYCSLLLLNF